MKNVSDKSRRENQNTHFVFSNFFFFENRVVHENVEKYCRAGQAKDDNMAHAHCMLDT
jgi:ABC-type polar amino acid transport system ATPase subunit